MRFISTSKQLAKLTYSTMGAFMCIFVSTRTVIRQCQYLPVIPVLLLTSSALVIVVLYLTIESSTNRVEFNQRSNSGVITNNGIMDIFWPTYPSSESPKAQKGELIKADSARQKKENTIKIILHWNDWMPEMGLQPLVDNRCPITSCLFTADRSLLNSSHIVLFSPLNNTSPKSRALPKYRKQDQRFVFVALGGYHHYSGLNSSVLTTNIYDNRTRFNYFNWTMTYRRNSDIFVSQNHDMFKPLTKLNVSSRKVWSPLNRMVLQMRRKKKLVAWFPSSCSSSSTGREEYVKNLSQHIPVDVYGKCGPKHCQFSKLQSSGCSQLDFEILRTDYKFYLAFEDTWCPDDITADFYKSLVYDTVPVVLGGADYDTLAPPYSYINALDFPSAKDLAQYLLLLSKSQKLYSKYFQWKKNYYHHVLSPMSGWCELCRMAHDTKMPVQTYHDIWQWWIKPPKCISRLAKPV